MAKQAGDRFTLELIDKPKRGRPRKPDALTDAQRAKRYRDNKRASKAQVSRYGGPTQFWRGPNGETWSGRGKKPRWYQIALERGIEVQFS